MAFDKVLKSFTAVLTFDLPPDDTVQLTIPFKTDQHIVETVRRIMFDNALPVYLESSILSTIYTLMLETYQLDTEHDAASTPVEPTIIQASLVDSYMNNTLLYSDIKDDDVFPKAYNTLVHTPIPGIFDTLLQLEQTYAEAVQDVISVNNDELARMERRQAREVETAAEMSPTQGLTHVVSRHVEEIEVLKATYSSSLETLCNTQKSEYRAFVIALYEECQLRLSGTSDPSQLDGKEIVSTVANRVRQRNSSVDASHESLTPTDQSASTHEHSAAASEDADTSGSTTHTSLSSNHKNEDPAQLNRIAQITEMGFDTQQAQTALMLTNQNTEAAITLLLEHPERITAAINNPQPPPRRSSKQYQDIQSPRSPGRTPQPNHRPPARQPSLPSLVRQAQDKSSQNQKSWSPISFLKEQKLAIENTHIAGVRRLSGWIGKAMEGLGIDGDEGLDAETSQASISPTLAESFTIALGQTQQKTQYNLRLLVSDTDADILNPLPREPQREITFRAQTASGLYSSRIGMLTAMVVLVGIKEWIGSEKDGRGNRYKMGKGSNQGLFERCKSSTEFHFDDIEKQISQVEKDFAENMVTPQEGDFFITRHSNLPLTQIVIHTFIDTDAISKVALHQRHPLLHALRNILLLTKTHDIFSLSFPLLLLPTSYFASTDNIPESNLIKRGDIVLKATKGFLLEQLGQAAEKGHGVGGVRTIEFLVDRRIRGGMDIEGLFTGFRGLLGGIFRTN